MDRAPPDALEFGAIPPCVRQNDAHRWRTALAWLALLFGCLLALYWRSAAGAVAVWYGSRAYNHGFLILPIVAYLIFERRDRLAGVVPVPYPLALLALPATGILWLIAKIAGVAEGQQLMLVVAVQAILLAVLGKRVYRTLRFPFLFLFFLVPTGDFLIPYLQEFTARFVVAALRLSGVPVFSDGFLIAIPNISFYVAEACAGLRFLIAMIMLGFLFADFAYRSPARRAAFVGLCVIVPIIANGLRAYGIILIAYLTNGQIAVEVDHILYGWLFFTIVMAGLVWLGWRFRDEGPVRPRPAEEPLSAGTRRQLAGVAAAALCLIALPRAYAALLERTSIGQAGRLTLPDAAAPWRAGEATEDWHPRFPGADLTALRRFNDAGVGQVDFFVAYYRRQSDDKKLVSAANAIAADANGEISARSSATLTIDGQSVPVAVSRISTPHGKRVILSLYWVDDRFTSSAFAAKLLQVKAALTGGRREAAFVAFASEFSGDAAGAIASVQDFAAHLGPLEPALVAVPTR